MSSEPKTDPTARTSSRELAEVALQAEAVEEPLLGTGPDAFADTDIVEPVIEVAAEDHDRMVVVILPDSGRGYLSKVFNDDWMRERGFL